MALHRLKVLNVQRVVSIAVHPSGRMLLALYGNGMLRLWNLLDARCHSKRMVGLSEPISSADEDAEEDEIKEKRPDTKKYESRPTLVRWTSQRGAYYGVLFGRLFELYSVDDDTPMHSMSFDTQ
jgi:hypothetical protein